MILYPLLKCSKSPYKLINRQKTFALDHLVQVNWIGFFLRTVCENALFFSVRHAGIRHLSDRHFPEVYSISLTLTHMDSLNNQDLSILLWKKGEQDLQLKLHHINNHYKATNTHSECTPWQYGQPKLVSNHHICYHDSLSPMQPQHIH